MENLENNKIIGINTEEEYSKYLKEVEVLFDRDFKKNDLTKEEEVRFNTICDAITTYDAIYYKG